jgi:23S rRNA pseudouridine955/2504/2580 synthase
METGTFIVSEPRKLADFIKANILGAGFIFVKNVLKNKDIKINGVRVGKDVMLAAGDTVQIYYPNDAIKRWRPYKIIYEDDNVVIVFKNRGIETAGQNAATLEKLVGYAACHRLDVNTEGLVIFAKNEKTAEEIKTAFKSWQVRKTYFALTFGKLRKSPLTLTGYLLKDKDRAEVQITREKQQGARPIKTVLEFVKQKGDFSLIKINPETGRTHQIRAHLASIGLYIVGDGKYGDNKMNKLYGENAQCLCAAEIKFLFSQTSPLKYLNKIQFVASPTFL